MSRCFSEAIHTLLVRFQKPTLKRDVKYLVAGSSLVLSPRHECKSVGKWLRVARIAQGTIDRGTKKMDRYTSAVCRVSTALLSIDTCSRTYVWGATTGGGRDPDLVVGRALFGTVLLHRTQLGFKTARCSTYRTDTTRELVFGHILAETGGTCYKIHDVVFSTRGPSTTNSTVLPLYLFPSICAQYHISNVYGMLISDACFLLGSSFVVRYHSSIVAPPIINLQQAIVLVTTPYKDKRLFFVPGILLLLLYCLLMIS